MSEETYNNTMNEESVTVTLTLDNDETLECVVLTIYEAGENQYIALLPLDDGNRNNENRELSVIPIGIRLLLHQGNGE